MELTFQVRTGSTEWESSPFLSYPTHLISPSLQGCYFCVKQFALECSRIPMGQAVNSQVCDEDRVIWSGQRTQVHSLPHHCIRGFMTHVVDVMLTAPFSCLTLGNSKLHSTVAQRLQRWPCPVPAHGCNVTHQVSAMQDLVCCKLGTVDIASVVTNTGT